MDLVKDRIKSLYLKFLIPSLGSAMVLSIYTLTDAIVIGKGVGADGLAALSITTPLLCILMATGILFGVGGSVPMNVFRGVGKNEKANRFFTLSFVSISFVAILLWAVYFFLMPNLISLMGANEILAPYANSYMHIINFFIPIAVFSNYLAIFVRADNNPNRSMLAVISGGIVNIVLDIVLVFPCHMGMAGAALASCLGMVLQIIVLSSHFISKKNNLKLIKPIKIVESIWNIFIGGIPSFFNEFANGFIVLLFNIQILKYCGNSALSVYSVISNCVILFNSLFTGVGGAIQPITSVNYGAKEINRVSLIRKYSLITVIIMGSVFSLLGILFPNLVCSVFLSMNSELESIANFGIRFYFIAFLPLGINLWASYYLQAVLETKKSLIISLLRNVILSGLGIMLFPLLFSSNSLWYVIPIVEVLVLCITVWVIVISNKKISKVF